MNDIVQIMNKIVKDNVDHFNLLRLLKKKEKLLCVFVEGFKLIINNN